MTASAEGTASGVAAPSDDAAYPYTVIVIGSGCSRELGVPTMVNFMDKVLEQAKGRDLQDIQGFISGIRASSAYVKNRLLNIEEVYGLADMQSEELGEEKQEREDAVKVKRSLNRTIYNIAERAGRDFLGQKSKERYPVSKLEEIKRESQTQRPLHQGYGTRYSTLLAYLCLADYVDWVDEQKRFPLFVQFNWDLALDRALMHWLAGQDLPKDREMPWYPRPDAVASTKRPLGRYDVLPQVARPHGGINWIEETAMKDDMKKTREKADAKLKKDLDERKKYLDEKCPSIEGIRIDPHPVVSAVGKPDDEWHLKNYMAIVPPTWRKEAGKTGLKYQWSVMKHGLEKVRRIVFIGYSLPKSDLYFRHFLALALRRNNYLPQVYVWNPSILNPASEEHQSYVDLFEPLAREGRLFGIAGRFGDPALFDLARAMREAVPLRVS